MKQELKERYTALYDYMVASRDTNNMKAFGHVMNEMMDWMVDNKSDMAQEWIDKLCAIRWDNYLTQKEAESIWSAMTPKAPWPRETWRNAMRSLGIATEEEPYYNDCALWVEMNKVYSDSAESIAHIKGLPLQDVPSEDMVRATHMLAMDHLKDKDGVYNIRSYFSL